MAKNIDSFQHYFFVGIAGTGMSAIAQYLRGIGKNVSGSDRLFNKDNKMLIQEQFESMGIVCHFQDASGITPDVDVVVVSTAIEESNVEYQAALQKGIPIMKRSELLAAISVSKRTIAVGGTSGKSTTTSMIFHILQENGYSPSLITGAGLTALQKKGLPGNAWVGESDWLVIESDESDGSIVNYLPEISVLLNIDRDHKEFDELIELFSTFKNNTHGRFIVNKDHPVAAKLSEKAEFDFGTNEGVGFVGNGFEQKGFEIRFSVNGVPFHVPVIGKHNMENTMASVAVASAIGIPVEDSAKAMTSYEGIYRRTQLVGQKNDICVIDDFAHNPAEVAAAIRACQQVGKRVFAWFQPHGFGPLRFMHEELGEEVAATLRSEDEFILSDVYYAGGTVDKNISPKIVSDAILEKKAQAIFIANRSELANYLQSKYQPGDVVLIMGARDITLSDFAMQILESVK
ncbi:MAG: Mur ligase domain-containing protein [Bacteroidota bacterium]|nr:Mur ligase domain-containing protein [Bacteroidota bacterium]